jgi:diguanylate cyclase (GGDEF)-like protein
MDHASPSRVTIHTKLTVGFAGAFVLVVAVTAFGASQLRSIHQVTKESQEIWLPRIEALSKMKSALGEHRLLATRQTQTTNFRHLATIAKDMEAMRAIVDGEAANYAIAAARGGESEVLSDFRDVWKQYRDSLKAVEQRLEVGELTAASTEFETVSLPLFVRATENLDLLNAVAAQRSRVTEGRAKQAYDVAFRLTLIVSLLAAMLVCAAILWTSRSVSLPIIRVSEAMRRLAKGDHSVTIAPGPARNDEISVLIGSVNRYRESLVREQQLAEMAERERDNRAREVNAQKLQFQMALTSMSQGLCVFDAEHRLVICNDRYLEAYGLAREHARSGTPVREILALRVTNGIYGGPSPEEYVRERLAVVAEAKHRIHIHQLPDGRVIELGHHPTPDGGWVATHDDITERRRLEARLEHAAYHDALTNLPNRVLLRERLEQMLGRSQPGDRNVAVLWVGLDRFREINDTLGHAIGDALLKSVADRLRGLIEDGDHLARLGGDEFAIARVASTPEDAATLASRILGSLGAPHAIEGDETEIGASIGIAVFPGDGNDPDQLLKNADLAMDGAKTDGRGTYRFFKPDMDARAQVRRSLERDLRKALANGEFELHYQPLVDLKRGEVSSFEALLRWNHPQCGRVSPGDFITLAEETGLILSIGEWALRQATADAATWPDHIKVAVNLSPVQFKDGGLVSAVSSALAAANLAPNRLELEITESVLLEESEATLAMLHELRALGVRFSMDDFGTGYSSLSYLRSFPFDKIKIDRSFVGDISTSDQSQAIVQAVTGLGTTLGMTTTAEGVETSEQLEHLRSRGCTEVQGYLFSPPRPAAEVTALIASIGQKRGMAA